MSSVAGVRVSGIASAVPARRVRTADQSDRFGEDALKIAESTGISERRVAGPGLTASDLCYAAAERLLAALGWPPETVDVLVFVSQSPDEFLPAGAASLQARLGLGRHAAAFDVSLGCSGFVYGLWLGASLLAAGQGQRVLLLVGDTISRSVDPGDRTTALLFGDAGTATALERGGTGRWVFSLGTDGRGHDALVVPGGAFRAPDAPRTLRMDGAEVFSFALREVPPMVASVLDEAGWKLADLDHVVFHQANRFLLQQLARKLKIPAEKLVVALERHGNTSGASIPLALGLGLAVPLRAHSAKLLVAGFGVGWSWGGAVLEMGPMVVVDPVDLGEASR